MTTHMCTHSFGVHVITRHTQGRHNFTHSSACDMGSLYHSDDPLGPGNNEQGFPRLRVIAPGTCVEVLLGLCVKKLFKWYVFVCAPMKFAAVHTSESQ
jgi:hypothetical protein